jgi:hypothetical protein
MVIRERRKKEREIKENETNSEIINIATHAQIKTGGW